MKYVFILFLLIGFTAKAQTCEIDSTMWEKVEIRLIESRKTPRKFKVHGEGIIQTHAGVSKLNDLTMDELKQIKLKAATRGCCIAFIDLVDAYGSAEFPMRKKNKLYFYYGYFN